MGRFGRRSVDFRELTDEEFVTGAYWFLYERDVEADAFENHMARLRSGARTRPGLLSEMRGLDDYLLVRFEEPLYSVHRSRMLWVQQLPRAARILDLGGSHEGRADGALVAMGYPYDFERLVIIDLPADERHDLYPVGPGDGVVDTARGPVEYVEGSMADLSRFGDESFDLVFSGQTIEHVTQADADRALAEVRRVLKPAGHFAVDTPNGAACRIQLAGSDLAVTNPDHEIEYTAAELTAKLERAGLRIDLARGLGHIPGAFETGVFSMGELCRSTGVFAEVERCYLLAYLCSKA
jgi:SAM-dependent methyltransferase